jgi:Protein phosphatase 2C
MKSPCWTWAAARSVGTSHRRVGKGCEDFCACVEVTGASETVLVAVTSDGAGSACQSAIGSWITARVFVQSAAKYVKLGGSLKSFRAEQAKEWLDEIRDRIGIAAAQTSSTPRNFAATLVGCMIGAEQSIFLHVGDGAFVCRAEAASEWMVPSWPAQGEYAATTFFVTDEPEARLHFVNLDQRTEAVAVFSDGLERLALQFSSKTAFSPFFERMFAPLDIGNVGRDRALSLKLRSFLDGPSVCDRTDDDKTLLLARRRLEAL